MINFTEKNTEKNNKMIKKLISKSTLKNIFNICFFIMFIITTFSVFYVTNQYLYFGIILFLLTIFILKKIKLIDIIKFNINVTLSFILLITIINLFLMDFNDAINITIKLFLTCNLSYILSIVLPSFELINTINILIKPLEKLKINTQTISLILTISITFIPILINELEKIRFSLVSKGIKYNSIKNIYYTLKIILPNILKKVNDIDNSLISKGINE